MKELGSFFKDRINEVVLADAIKKSAIRFTILDVLLDAFKRDTINKEDLSKKIDETNQKNYVCGYINGVEDAIKGDYGVSYLYPSSKTNCDLVNNVDFALVFTFGDNDFGGFFEECAKIYENNCWDCFNRLNIYSSLEQGQLMVDSCLKEIKEMQSKSFLQTFFKTTFLGAYLKQRFDYYDCFTEMTYEKSLEKGKYLTEEYMPFNNDDNWFIGTCAEVDTYLKENYENTFNGNTTIWDNGETLVFKIQNGVIDYKII